MSLEQLFTPDDIARYKNLSPIGPKVQADIMNGTRLGDKIGESRPEKVKKANPQEVKK
jgi:hypothetical protein